MIFIINYHSNANYNQISYNNAPVVYKNFKCLIKPSGGEAIDRWRNIHIILVKKRIVN